MVTEMLVGVDGAILESSVYPAVVQNHAQLTYNAVAAWLEGKKDLRELGGSDITARVLEKIVHNNELADQLKLQNEVAEQLRERRHLAGALSLETTELQPILSPEGHVIDLDTRKPNRAQPDDRGLNGCGQSSDGLISGTEERPQYSASRRRIRNGGTESSPWQAHLAAISLRDWIAKSLEGFSEARNVASTQITSMTYPSAIVKLARARGVRVEIAGKSIAGTLSVSDATLCRIPRRRTGDTPIC